MQRLHAPRQRRFRKRRFRHHRAAIDFITPLQSELLAHGFRVRVGLHAGTVEMTPHGPAGLPVLVAEDLLNVANEGEIVATRTVVDLLHSGDVHYQRIPGAPRTVLRNTWDLYILTTPAARDESPRPTPRRADEPDPASE